MKAKADKKSRKARRVPKAITGPVGQGNEAGAPESAEADAKRAAEQYVRGILIRGEAAKQGEPLPPGATHEIVGEDEEGRPKIQRKRFSLA